MKKTLIFSGFVSVIASAIMFGIFVWYQSNKSMQIEYLSSSPATKALYTSNDSGKMILVDFTGVAAKVMDAVVHIKSTYKESLPPFQQLPDPFEELFPDHSPFRDFFFRKENPTPRQQQLRIGQGSGVIIGKDGYIVTNNHVVADAEDIEVTLHDNRNYKASVIGTDPSTDLALIRIKEEGLSALPFVNSDNLKVGEWVLAGGNPFNLTSTVTAGIVSAKWRNINILREQYAVESFIQTDAAINMGNSGGALVNLEGGLVGINTAIASPTGVYSGYGFAIPSNIVSKVVQDLMQYGVVQRGVLGVIIRTVDGNLKKENDLNVSVGVYVDSLFEKSAAGAAGVKAGDVIMEIDGLKVESSPELQEIIARHRPGDVVSLKVDRKGSVKEFKVTLTNRKGGTDLVKKEQKDVLSLLGADFETLNEKTARKLGLEGGVRVKKLGAGILSKQTGIQEGYIITKVDGQPVKSVADLEKVLEKKKGGVMFEGIYENMPGVYFYAFGM